MKPFARITSFVFVGLGLLIILGGILFALSAFFGERPTSTGLFDMTGVMILAQIGVGGAISLQGFLLAAIGEAIWLLVDIAENTEKTSAYFAARMRMETA